MSYEFPTSRGVFLWRGLSHRCPRCGDRHTHTKYFSVREQCPTCSLKFEKEHGYWTGAIVVNFILTGGAVVIGLILGLVVTAPDIPVVPLMSLLIPIAVLFPIALYPFTHTLWMAIDYGFMSRLDN